MTVTKKGNAMTMRDGIRTEATNDPAITADRTTTWDAPWSGRLRAWIFAARYDTQVEAGVRPTPGSPLAVHCARLSSRRERRALEQTLTNVLLDAGLTEGGHPSTMRVPIDSDAVRRSADLICDAIARLAGPLPLHRRGVARLRILLGDGRGPLYRSGSGTLAAAMRGVLSAM